jgi:hypothetical protein
LVGYNLNCCFFSNLIREFEAIIGLLCI